jgi:hypothetical protein
MKTFIGAGRRVVSRVIPVHKRVGESSKPLLFIICNQFRALNIPDTISLLGLVIITVVYG